MSERTGKIQTVLGPIDPADLGFTQTHEHFFVSLLPPAIRADYEGEPITLENVGYLRRNWVSNPANLVLDSYENALDELKRYKAAGGGAMVDVSPIGTERNPEKLAKLSKESGVHIVMGTGYYLAAYHPPELEDLSEERIADIMIKEVVDGVDDTGIKVGVVGEIGLDAPMYDDEVKVLRAAAIAHNHVGGALNIHPGRAEEEPFNAMKIVSEVGGNSERTIMSHVERTFFDLDNMLRLAETGCYLEFDLFGQEMSYYPMGDFDMPNDATRIDYIMGLIERGYRDKLLISLDICFKTRLSCYGGEGYSHIIDNVVPMMRRKGVSKEDIDAITVANPARILAFA